MNQEPEFSYLEMKDVGIIVAKKDISSRKNIIVIIDTMSIGKDIDMILNVYTDLLLNNKYNYHNISLIKTFPKISTKTIDRLFINVHFSLKEIIKCNSVLFNPNLINETFTLISQIINQSDIENEIHFLTKKELLLNKTELDSINGIFNNNNCTLKFLNFHNGKCNLPFDKGYNIMYSEIPIEKISDDFESYSYLFKNINSILFENNTKLSIHVENKNLDTITLSISDSHGFIIYNKQIPHIDFCFEYDYNMWFLDNKSFKKSTLFEDKQLIYHCLLNNIINIKWQNNNVFTKIMFIDKIYKDYCDELNGQLTIIDPQFEYKFKLVKFALADIVIKELITSNKTMKEYLYSLIQNVSIHTSTNNKVIHIMKKRVIDNIYEIYNIEKNKSIIKLDNIDIQSEVYNKSIEFYYSPHTKTNWYDEISKDSSISLLFNIGAYTTFKIIGLPLVTTSNISNELVSTLAYIEYYVANYNKPDKNIHNDNMLSKYNAILPLYVNNIHWKSVKKYLNQIIGIVCYGHPLLFTKSHINIYFIVLTDMMGEYISTHNVDNIRVLLALLRTCHQIMIENKYHSGIKSFVSSYINKKSEQIKTDYKKLLGQILASGYFFNKITIDLLINVITENIVKQTDAEKNINMNTLNGFRKVYSVIQPYFNDNLIGLLDTNNGILPKNTLDILCNKLASQTI